MALTVVSLNWVHREIHGKPPSPRQGHTACLIGDVAYVFGGMRSVDWPKKGTYFFRDLYQLHLYKRMQWEKVKQKGDIPKGRYGHHMCVIDQKIYLFGGKHELQAEQCLSGLHVFNTETRTWSEPETSGTEPMAHGSTAGVVGKRIYVYGGLVDGQAVDDIYCLDTECHWWVKLTVKGIPPSPRCDAACASINHHLYVFGGTGGSNQWHNDIHVFNTDKLMWKHLNRMDGDPPPPRGNHSFTAHADKDIYVFGGSNDSSGSQPTFGDLFKFSLEKRKWKRPFYSGCAPAKRSGHAAIIHRNKLIIIGGSNEDTDFNDVHVAKLINPSKRQPLKVSANDMHDFLSAMNSPRSPPAGEASEPNDAHFLAGPEPDPAAVAEAEAAQSNGHQEGSVHGSIDNEGSITSTSSQHGKSVRFEDEHEAHPDSARSDSSSSSSGSASSLSSAASESSQGSSSSGATSDSKDNNSGDDTGGNANNNNNNNANGSNPPSNLNVKGGVLPSILRNTEGEMKAEGVFVRSNEVETGFAKPSDASIPETEGDKGRVTRTGQVGVVDSKSAGSPEPPQYISAGGSPPPAAEQKPGKAASSKSKKKLKKKNSSEKMTENRADPTIPTPQMQPPVPAADWRSAYPPTMNGYPPSTNGYPPSTNGYPPSTNGYPPSGNGYPPSMNGYPPVAQEPPYGSYNGWRQPVPEERMNDPRHSMEGRQMSTPPAASAPDTENDDESDDVSTSDGSDDDEDSASESESESEDEPEAKVRNDHGASMNGAQPGMYDPYGAMANPGYPDPHVMRYPNQNSVGDASPYPPTSRDDKSPSGAAKSNDDDSESESEEEDSSSGSDSGSDTGSGSGSDSSSGSDDEDD